MISKPTNIIAIAFAVLLIILPLILGTLVAYTIYLKIKLKRIEIKIKEIPTTFTSTETNVEKVKVDLNIPEALLEEPKGILIKEKINYNFFIRNSKTLFIQNEIIPLKYFNESDAFSEALKSIQKKEEFFITKLSTQTYTLYRKSYTEPINYVYTIQIRFYTKEEYAFITALTLRNAGFPAFIYEGILSSTGTRYYAVCLGLFSSKDDALFFSDNLDAEKLKELIGSSVGDRFVKRIGVSE